MEQFTIVAIPADDLARLREKDDAGNPPRRHANADQPLRCCLRRSSTDDALLLISYAPLRRWALETGADPGPYLETGPVFIHADACDGPAASTVPAEMIGQRRVCRAYDGNGRILGGEYVEQTSGEVTSSIAEVLTRQFARPQTALVHVRAVEFGCFLFEARRSRGMPDTAARS